MKAFGVGNRYKTSGDLGIEIEIEGENLPHLTKYWRTERDGSLRGESAEYVLSKPLTRLGARNALKYLDKKYIDSDTVVHDSVRAGVHVHVNVQDISVVELFSFITSYVILEDLLVNYCGEYREGNLFCLRIRDADYLMYCLEQAAKDKNYNALHTDALRYASMNVKSLHQYGSLEFRAMRGTRDLGVIDNWANILLNLRNVAKEFQSPKDIIKFYEEHGAESFLERFLGVYKEEVSNHLTKEYNLQDGIVRAYDLATNTDWESFKMMNIGGLEFPVGTEFPDEPQEDY